MARFGTWRPVDRYQSGSLKVSMKPRRLIYHTAVSNATPSMHSYFNVSGRATPHFYVGKNGEIEQYIDTDFRSTANLDGNHDCITVETWDGYGTGWTGSNVPKWTPAQVESLAAIAARMNQAHDIPLTKLPSSRPGTRGVGWHRLGVNGNFPSGLLAGRVSGGEVWSSSSGKVCPGDNRIHQIDEIITKAKGPQKKKTKVSLSKLNSRVPSLSTTRVKNRLGRRGFFKGLPTPFPGTGFRNAYRRYQESLGYTGSDADGVPGKASLEKLGFRVVA